MTAPSLIPPSPVALTSLRAGQTATVAQTAMDPRDAAMLRAMGLRPNATIRLRRLGEPCIVEVLSGGRDGCAETGGRCCCRIGLARPLADRVLVGPGSPEAPAPATTG